MQSGVAVAYKVFRIFYVILTKGVDYVPSKDEGRYPKNSHRGCVKEENGNRNC